MTTSPATQKVLLVGNGPMADEYMKVLTGGLGIEVAVAGRDWGHVTDFGDRWQLRERFLVSELTAQTAEAFPVAILSTAANSLPDMIDVLFVAGFRAILTEKPAAFTAARCLELAAAAESKGVLVRVATNRRFYQATRALQKIVQAEGAVSAYFDFSEPAASIGKEGFSAESLRFWACTNSIHVFDTVRFLLGELRLDRAEVHDRGAVEWHAGGNTFGGLMIAGAKVPVVYHASWIAPGRWDIQVLTRAGRYKLSPMEKLQVMPVGSFNWTEVELDYAIDSQYKPGVFGETSAFLAEAHAWIGGHPAGPSDLPDLAEQAVMLDLIHRVVGYPT